MMDGQIRLTTPEPTTLLNLNITKRDNSNIVCLSNNAKGSVLHHLANIFAPLPKKKKIKVEPDHASRSVLFNRTFCTYGIFYIYTKWQP